MTAVMEKTKDKPVAKLPLPKIGKTVQFITQGDLRLAPRAAVVLQVYEQVGPGAVMVKIFGMHHDECPGTVIRHIDDPYHLEYPESLKANGAWREVQ